MSEAASTESPAGETPAAVEETLAPEDNPAEIYKQLFADSDDKPKAEEPKEEPVVEAAPAAEAVEVVEEPPKEEPKKADLVELEVAKVEREKRQLESTLATEKKARTAAESKLAEFTKALDTNWIAAVEKHLGAPFHEIMERAAKGEWDAKAAPTKPELDDETKEVLAWAKEERKAKAEAKAAEERTANKNKNAPVIKAFVEGVTDDYPLLTSMPNATQAILDIAFDELEKTGRQPDLHKIAAEIEEEAIAHSNIYFGNEKLLAAILKDPKRLAAVKALVAPVVAAPAGKTPAAAAPASGRLAAPAEVIARTAKADADDEESERQAHIKALRSHQERAN